MKTIGPRAVKRYLGRVLALAAVLAGAIVLLPIGGAPARPTPAPANGRRAAVSDTGQRQFAVGKIAVRFIDTRRLVHFPGRPPQPRPLETEIWYPAIGDPSRVGTLASPPATASGPFPLVVFGHGYDSSPGIYSQLLQAWARAGYVVAAPVFPLTNADAPGGPKESDIVNQPADMSFVITRILASSAADRGTLSGLVDGREVAVSGQSDGAATALASAYDSRYLDRRVNAAIILSGAEIMPGQYFRGGEPPLLAMQGTADKVNLPKYTYQFFRAARSPKFLLTLLGARHLGPYTSQQPQLSIVERVTVAFLDRYLKRLPGARRRLWSAATGAPLVARLSNGL